MKYQIYMQTPMGWVRIAQQDDAIVGLEFCAAPEALQHTATPLLERAKHQLLEYMQADRTEFDLPLCPQGTPFQKRVWSALHQIPYGQTRSYRQVAEMIGQPTAMRAVGMANGKNPIPIIIPCHRVIGAGGKLVGYSGGLDKKTALLTLEHVNVGS